MKIRPLRSLAAAALVTTLALTGCSSDDSADDAPSATETQTDGATDTTSDADKATLEKVSVTTSDDAKPEVTFDGPLTFEGNAAYTAEQGDGGTLAEGDLVAVNMSVYSGEDASATNSTYDNDALTHLLLDPTQIPASFVAAMTEAGVGGTVLLGQPGVEATEEGGTTQPAYVYVVEIEQSVPTSAQGEDVAQDDDSLPQVTLDDTGKPSVEIPDGYKGTDELQVITLKKGDGPEVGEMDFVWSQYSGWQLDGTQFDSSWERGKPMGFQLMQVIQGWSEGLAGVPIGSQVMLIVPGDMGYGEGEGTSDSGQPLGDLIFVVDVLGVN